MTRRVIIVSPHAGDIATNEAYARACMRDCLERGESPIVFHLLYTQPGVLDDRTPSERDQGMRAARDWYPAADTLVVYSDLPVSGGMREDIEYAQRLGKPIDWRMLSGWSDGSNRDG